MKSFIFIAVFLSSLCSVQASMSKRILNPKFNWVEILNGQIDHGHGPMGIDVMWISRDGKPYKNNICSIGSTDGRFSSSLKVIGMLQDDEYIFEYTREGIAYGAPCPTGVFFKASLEDII